jgi:hypothetical protein
VLSIAGGCCPLMLVIHAPAAIFLALVLAAFAAVVLAAVMADR